MKFLLRSISDRIFFFNEIRELFERYLMRLIKDTDELLAIFPVLCWIALDYNKKFISKTEHSRVLLRKQLMSKFE